MIEASFMREALRHLLLENQMSHESHASQPQAESKARSTLHPTTHQPKKGNNQMKLEIDWAGMLKAALKAIWPFIAGAVGGIFSGCTIGGIGPNFL